MQIEVDHAQVHAENLQTEFDAQVSARRRAEFLVPYYVPQDLPAMSSPP
jgi:hypothetical protein